MSVCSAPAGDRARAVRFLSGVAREEAQYRSRLLFRNRMAEAARRSAPGPLRAGGSVVPPGEVSSRLSELDRDLENAFADLCAHRKEVLDLLSSLDNPRGALLLESFYVSGMTMRAAAAYSGYDERHAYRVRDRSLAELGRRLSPSGAGGQP